MNYPYILLTYSRNILPRRVKRYLWTKVLIDCGVL
jgi:hypothetical protein